MFCINTIITAAGVNVPVSEVLKNTSHTKCAVYADLWERGYYITAGNKFGGDFLAYLGKFVGTY